MVGEELGIDVTDKAGKAKASAIIRAWIKTGAFRVEEAPDAKREMRKFIVTGSPA